MKTRVGFAAFLTVCAASAVFSCSSESSKNVQRVSCDDYRKAMRDFVIQISDTARKVDSDFIVIPQNGQNVAWNDDAEELEPDSSYFSAIDGCGREDTFYGMNSSYDIADGEKTPENLSAEIQEMCDVYVDAELVVLSTDYTKAITENIEDSFSKNEAKGYISFAATERNLNVIPDYEPYNKNTSDIKKLSDAKNFLYIINPDDYNKETFISALKETDYDVIIIDLFITNDQLSKEDIDALKTKKNGCSRLVICYMSIGEAEDYRWYWSQVEEKYLYEENPDWKGNYKVCYWDPDWQKIICGENGYLSKILDSGFDGVYLDIIDAFEYFEEKGTL